MATFRVLLVFSDYTWSKCGYLFSFQGTHLDFIMDNPLVRKIKIVMTVRPITLVGGGIGPAILPTLTGCMGVQPTPRVSTGTGGRVSRCP